jgi:hypothetical protein
MLSNSLNTPANDPTPIELRETIRRGSIEQVHAVTLINTPREQFVDTMRMLGEELSASKLEALFLRLAPEGSLSQRCDRTKLGVELMIGAHPGSESVKNELVKSAETAFAPFPKYGYDHIRPISKDVQIAVEDIPEWDERKPMNWIGIH